jgi:pyrroline-5-carboxylate reductase
MAYALLKGICSTGHDYSAIYVCDTNPAQTDIFAREFSCIPGDKREVIAGADVIILAVKPGQVEEVLQGTGDLWTDRKLLVSIAAGIRIGSIQEWLRTPVPVIRVMPNTPCLVGEGICAYAPGQYAKADDIDLVRNILNKMGMSVFINESYMDAVTAVSGSGPAYAFLVIEAMIDAAVQVGLAREIAEKLVIQTFKGSLRMLEETGEHPAVLKAQVTSPGGTTIAALRELEAGGLRTAFFNAVEKACQRSVELG